MCRSLEQKFESVKKTLNQSGHCATHRMEMRIQHLQTQKTVSAKKKNTTLVFLTNDQYNINHSWLNDIVVQPVEEKNDQNDNAAFENQNPTVNDIVLRNLEAA